MKGNWSLFGLAAALCVSSAVAKDVTVGGAPMYSSKNIVENAVRSKNLTTLVAAVKAAGLVETLEGPGPFTVFAPTNEAFQKLPAGTIDTLLQPENKGKLEAVLNYHVVRGRLTTTDLIDKIKANGGRFEIETVEGQVLIARYENNAVVIADDSGDSSRITVPNVAQSNGILHVVNTVFHPKTIGDQRKDVKRAASPVP